MAVTNKTLISCYGHKPINGYSFFFANKLKIKYSNQPFKMLLTVVKVDPFVFKRFAKDKRLL